MDNELHAIEKTKYQGTGASSNPLLIDGLEAIRQVLRDADYQECFITDGEIIETIRETVNLAQYGKALLRDIKAWDLGQATGDILVDGTVQFRLPLDLRKRINAIQGI